MILVDDPRCHRSHGSRCPQILIAMNCKDEPNITEWVIYHALMRFTRIVIFDDLSSTPIEDELLKSDRCIRPLLADLGITLVIYRFSSQKGEYLRIALREARSHQMDWMIYIDADEYIVTGRYGTVTNLIYSAPSTCQGIALFWKCFGSSFLDHNPRPGQCIPMYTQSERGFSPKLKTLARVSAIYRFRSPHHYEFHDGSPEIWEPNTDQWIPNTPIQMPPEMSGESAVATPTFLAHYTQQSWSCFRRRRCRPRDDTGTIRSFDFSLQEDRSAPDAFHALYNDVTEHGVRQCFFRLATEVFSAFVYRSNISPTPYALQHSSSFININTNTVNDRNTADADHETECDPPEDVCP